MKANTASELTCSNAQYDTIIIGGGPAGLGPLVAASKSGQLDAVLDKGVCVIEKGPTIGGGAFNNYSINSDTPGGILLECFSEHNDRSLQPLRRSHSAQVLEANDSGFVPLKLIGNFLDGLGSCLEKIINNHPSSNIFLNSEVSKVEMDRDGRYTVEIRRTILGSGKENIQLTARKIIMAPGGSQNHLRSLSARLFNTETRLSDFPEKSLIQSDSVLKNDSHFQKLLSDIDNGSSANVVVIGSSHSAFSSALFLLKQLRGKSDNVKIKILYRTEPKIYYPSADDAPADGFYQFDKNDVCIATNRIFRFGGIRMESRDLLRSIHGLSDDSSSPPVELVKFTNEPKLQRLLSDSTVIISALGYRPDYVPIFDDTGAEITPGTSDGKYVDSECRLLSNDGQIIRNCYGVGLASGYVPDNGGEPSFTGQTNSIWIYQNPAGNILLEKILADQTEVSRAVHQ